MDRGTQLAHPCFDSVQRAIYRYMYRGEKKERERVYNTHTHTIVYMYIVYNIDIYTFI